MSIEKLANITARKVGRYLNSPEYISEIVSKKKGREITLDYEECIGVFSYSLEVIFGESTKIILMCLIGYFCGVLDITIGALIAFCVLRSFAGGYHMQSFGKCLITTICLIASASVFSIFMVRNIYIVPLILIANFIIIKLYAPVGSEEKPIETHERRKELQGKSITTLIIFSTLAILLIFFKLTSVGCALISGILIEGFTITPFGIYILHKFENIFNFKSM